jgi:NitT/TauT family transport system permease protein
MMVHVAAQAVTNAAGVFAAILDAMGNLLHGIVRGLEAKIVHRGDCGRK